MQSPGTETSQEAALPRKVIWWPQAGPQTSLVNCPMAEIFFGGARGGGKTDGVLGKWAIKEKRYGRNFNAVMFRRTTVSSEDAIERSKEIYKPLGGKFNESKLIWRMPNGGRMAFAYLDSIADANEYQGRNVTDAWVEEAGQYERPDPIDRLFGVLRSAHGVPVQLILTANPGGAGQHWIRARYGLHPFPRSPKVLERALPTGETHRIAVIPSRIADNKILLQADPGYVGRLHMVGSAQLVKAWLDGDWTAIEGAFFDCWSEDKHVIPPFAIPSNWLRFRSADWGSASPFSIGWWAVVQDDYDLSAGATAHVLGRIDRSGMAGDVDRWAGRRDGDARRGAVLPRGALVRYREWYGANESNRGLKLTAEQVGEGIVARERGEHLTYAVLDPSTFKEDGGPSIAERMNDVILRAKMSAFHAADNTRVTTRDSRDRRGPMNGWDAMRHRLVGIDGIPMLYCFETCRDSIRTIPVLQHDDKRAEDLDTTSEDHAADDWRYACSSRPWVRTEIPIEEPRDGYRDSRDDALDERGPSILTM